MDFLPQDEIRRKSFHLLSLLYILAYWVLPRDFVLVGLGALIVVVIFGEILRLRIPAFNERLLGILGGVHRDEEVNSFSGLPWTLFGSFLTILIFPNKTIVLISFLYLAFGDAIAALVGRWAGKHKLLGDKSIEGSVGCFVACFIIGLFFFNAWHFALLAAFLATLVELVPWPLNDNFWMPLVSASFLTLLAPILF